MEASDPLAGPVHSAAVSRLNWGCGSDVRPGWKNADVKAGPGVEVICDIREGLPLANDSIDYAVSIHALQELSYPELVPALRELRRVLQPGGVLRLGLPDLNRGIRAYLRGERNYFKVDEPEVQSWGGQFILHMLWYGHSRILFTFDFIEELLLRAGFADVTECVYGETKSTVPDIVHLDNREEESIFVEGTTAAESSFAPCGKPSDD
jgi:predicted SAM-dependent methyltransferase